MGYKSEIRIKGGGVCPHPSSTYGLQPKKHEIIKYYILYNICILYITWTLLIFEVGMNVDLKIMFSLEIILISKNEYW